MAIVSSVLIDTSPQIDHRFWSGERHTDQLGVVYIYRSLLAAGTNATTVMTNRIPSINALIIANETSANLTSVETLGSSATVTNNYVAQAAMDLAVRQAFQTATGITAILIGDYLRTLSVARLTVAFNIGSAVALVAVLNTLGTTATTVRTAVGQ